MTNIMPIVQIYMDTRGTGAQHDLMKLVEDVQRMDVSVMVINCGTLRYVSTDSMASAICACFRRCGIRVSCKPIRNDLDRVMLFKI